MLSRESSATLISAVTAFIYKEARLQDEHAYEAWEALWTDDGVYWVPANGDNIDPEKEMSIIYDNRSRISLRIKHDRQAPHPDAAVAAAAGRVQYRAPGRAAWRRYLGRQQ